MNKIETDPQIPAAAAYKFNKRETPRGTYILIDNGTTEKPYPVSYLLQIYKSEVFRFPEPVREMARQALERFGLLPDLDPEDDLKSMTIVTIDGVKVYQEWTGKRRFVARFLGRVIRSRSLTELEKAIRGE